MRKNHTLIISVLLALLLIFIAVYVFVAFIWDRMETKESVAEIDENIAQINIEKTTKKTFATFSIPKTNTKTLDDYFNQLIENEEKHFREVLEKAEYEQAELTFDSKISQIHDKVYLIEMSSEEKIDDITEDKEIFYTIDLKNDDFITVKDLIKSDQVSQFLETPNEAGEPIQDDAYLRYIFDMNDHDLLLINPDTGDIAEEIELVDLFDLITEDYKDVIFSGPLLSKGKPVAITFDDGPSPDTTPGILDTLKEYDVQATFFNLTRNTEKYPDIASRIVDEGHEIANHSISHRDLITVGDYDLELEVMHSKEIIEDATGESPTLFRPPYGSIDDRVKSVIKDSDQTLAMWSIDTLDWQNQDPDTILNNIKERIRPGSIILVHDIQPATAQALPKILDYLEAAGYHQTTMSELIPYIQNTYNDGYYGKE